MFLIIYISYKMSRIRIIFTQKAIDRPGCLSCQNRKAVRQLRTFSIVESVTCCAEFIQVVQVLQRTNKIHTLARITLVQKNPES